MEELYTPENSCPRCGSTLIEYYPDGGYHCNACGFSNMPEKNL
jgi:ribosomal protein S27AE